MRGAHARKWRTGLVLLVLGAMVAWIPPALAAGGAHDEAPMRVATEGMTAAEHLQRQAELSLSLAGELPAAALGQAIRIGLAPEEIAGVEQGSPRATPLKIGIVKPITPGIDIDGLDRGSATLPHRGDSGRAFATSDGGHVWAAVIAVEGAGAIRLHVEDLTLPSNGELYFYSKDGQVHGPYKADGPNGTGELWTGTIFGPEAILQVRVSAPSTDAELSSVSFRVKEAGLITPSFAAGFRPPYSVPAAPPPPGWPCGNANCIVDASCYGGIADTLSLAEAKMEWIQGAFIYTCSGGLVSDNNPTQNNFFLTANHCLSKNTNAQNVNFYWRFATSSCNASSCPSNGGWPYQTAGSTVSKSGRKGDFTLLHLNANPPAGSVFLGWTSAPVANSNGTGLFRVSNPNFGPQVYSEHAVDTGAPTCTGWPRGERIYARDTLGAIDGGSSGSPVVNGSAQIVGQLSGTCGFNPSNVCASGPGEDNATVDGAFAYYYSLVQPIINP